MAAPAPTGLVYDDLAGFPDDNLRRELIGGELVVTPAPSPRHQRAARELFLALHGQTKQHGGEALFAPLDVLFTDADVVEPDVLYIAAEHLDRVEERFLRGAPDIVVEVSSPSTRRLELVRKRALYERHGVAEYWYVDLDADRVEVYRLDEQGRYPTPTLLTRADTLTTPLLAGWRLSLDEMFAATEPPGRAR